ncbi:MAG: multicopper oxidase domain-containing protein, partial [Rhodobacteraceae bacterium]|nr:multicopper oxidase domain-containing protein [Paracoccaceae bacterium]
MKTMLSILNGISVPVVALDRDLIVVSANQKAKSAFVDLVLGAPAEKAISKKRVFQRALVQALEDNIETTCIVRIKKGFGHEYLTTIQPIDATDDTSALLIVTFQDQSPLKDAKTMRSEFVANVSHELRSPLTSLSGFIETLQGPAKDDAVAQERFLSLMSGEAHRMSRLIGDLLSLSKLQASERVPPSESVDISSILRGVSATLEPLMKREKNTISLTVSPDLPLVIGDADELTQVFQNLIENGVKYSHPDTVVEVIAERDPSHENQLRISVHDHGEGLDPIHIPRLTERFYRVDKGRSRAKGGTGLGLAIVKHILARHRGRLHVTNKIGEVSTLHWHGMHLPAIMDGGPHQAIADGGSWHPEFEVRQRASTLWYHAHTMHKT